MIEKIYYNLYFKESIRITLPGLLFNFSVEKKRTSINSDFNDGCRRLPESPRSRGDPLPWRGL